MSESIPTREDLLRSFRRVGVATGDTLYVASSMSGLGMMSNPMEDTISALCEAVGEDGTLVMPTFNFGFCEGAPFDVGQTPSTCGQLTEAFRTHPKVLRSCSPPYHSIAAWGRRARELSSIDSVTSFGPTSVFERMYQLNARCLLLGVGFESGVVHVHWLEERIGVPYRDWKAFESEVRLGGIVRKQRHLMYARRSDLNIALDAEPLGKVMDEAGCVQHDTVGLCNLQSFDLQDFARVVEPRMRQDPLLVLTPASRAEYLIANQTVPGKIAV